MSPRKKTVFSEIMMEVDQYPSVRCDLIKKIREKLGRTVVTFFTSFDYSVMIQDNDADMLEQVLQATDINNGLVIIISSPGGLGLAAERIINICRSYSDTSDYWAIVPSKAKSAATLICFGAKKIIMSDTSELGPVDPQISLKDESGNSRIYSLCSIVKSYESLFRSAVRIKQGRLEPYLQQLANYDHKDIAEYKLAIELSKDISIKALKTGMMRGLTLKKIENMIKIFLTPETTKTHGRPIYADDASKCGLNIESINVRDDLWELINKLYVRSNYYVSHKASKCIETAEDAAYTPLHKEV